MVMKNIFLINGTNTYQSKEKLNEMLKDFELSEIETYTGKNLDIKNFSTNLNTVPFLCDQRVILLKNFFSESQKEEQEILATELEKSKEFNKIIIYENKSLDKRLVSYKKLKKIATIYEFSNLERSNAQIWLSNYLKKKNIEAEISFARKLINHTSSFDENRLISEIKKIQTYANGKKLTEKMIEDLCKESISLSIFNLTEAISNKKEELAIKTLKKISESGEDPFFIFNMIIRQFRILITTKDLLEKKFNKAEILKKTGFKRYPVELAIPQTKNFCKEKLAKIYEHLLEIEIQTKTGKITTSANNSSELIYAIEDFIRKASSKY